MKATHYSVLKDEIISKVKKLKKTKGGIYVDATLGLGGHVSEFLKEGIFEKIIAIEYDKEILEYAKKQISKIDKNNQVIYINDNFKNIDVILKSLKINKVDFILFDLGVNLYQLTTKERGFSYHGENVNLDMRLNNNQLLTASNILNEYSVEELQNIFSNYGEESKSLQLAREIINARKTRKITTNTQLNEIIKTIKPNWTIKNPFKNIYQALRMEVNDELNNIKIGINLSLKLLVDSGILMTITFHSIEDKLVKSIFQNAKNTKKETIYSTLAMFKTSKTIYPTKQEIKKNISSRSAKLRTIVKTKNYD